MVHVPRPRILLDHVVVVAVIGDSEDIPPVPTGLAGIELVSVVPTEQAVVVRRLVLRGGRQAVLGAVTVDGIAIEVGVHCVEAVEAAVVVVVHFWVVVV